MDRLSLKYVGVSLGTAALLFILVRPTLAQIAEQEADPRASLASDGAEVSVEPGSNGYQQIYYTHDGQKVFITDTNYTNADPVAEGEYIAWTAQINEGWRIFRYHIPTQTTTQVTQTGIHVNPAISNGKVVWEGQVEGVWQIFLFDGTRIQQVTERELSLNPDIEGDTIVYAQRANEEGWRAEQYTISTKERQEIRRGPSAKHPRFLNGTIVFLFDTKPAPSTTEVNEASPSPTATSSPTATVSSAPSVSPTTDSSPFPTPTPLPTPDAPPTVTPEEIEEELSASPSLSPAPSPSPSEPSNEDLLPAPASPDSETNESSPASSPAI